MQRHNNNNNNKMIRWPAMLLFQGARHQVEPIILLYYYFRHHIFVLLILVHSFLIHTLLFSAFRLFRVLSEYLLVCWSHGKERSGKGGGGKYQNEIAFILLLLFVCIIKYFAIDRIENGMFVCMYNLYIVQCHSYEMKMGTFNFSIFPSPLTQLLHCYLVWNECEFDMIVL